jgi:N-carbamoylputrescine amidase
MTSNVSTSPAAGSIKVACIQMQPVFGNGAANVAHSLELIDRAASQGVNLVVLPELSNTGYMFASREEAFGLAEQIPGGPSVEAWAERAARHGMHIVAGIAERSGPDLYNSAVVIGP